MPPTALLPLSFAAHPYTQFLWAELAHIHRMSEVMLHSHLAYFSYVIQVRVAQGQMSPLSSFSQPSTVKMQHSFFLRSLLPQLGWFQSIAVVLK